MHISEVVSRKHFATHLFPQTSRSGEHPHPAITIIVSGSSDDRGVAVCR
jgi:hypothetical protein